MQKPWVAVCISASVLASACAHLNFNQSGTRASAARASSDRLGCASSASQAVARVCFKESLKIENSAKKPEWLEGVLTRGLVDCGSNPKLKAAELVVDDTSLTLKDSGKVIAEVQTSSFLDEAMTQAGVLPLGSCEIAFQQEVLARREQPDQREFFGPKDVPYPSVLYRGSGLDAELISKILGPEPQHVLATWTYSKLQAELPVTKQQTTLSALRIREQIYAALIDELQPPSGTEAGQGSVSQVVRMLNLQEEAMAKSGFGKGLRSNTPSRALSASAKFSQAFAYAKMHVSASQIGIVLSYKNTPGRSLWVLESEWATFSHVAKSDQLVAFLIFPEGEGVERDLGVGKLYYRYPGYKIFRVRRETSPSSSTLFVAPCGAYDDPSKQDLPTCSSEVKSHKLSSKGVPDRMKQLMLKVPQ